MRHRLVFCSFFVCVGYSSNPAMAASCNSDQRDKAQYFADISGEKIVSEYGGGQNINTTVNKCEFNSYSNEFRLKVEITWNGVFFSNEYYNSDGVLKISEDGSSSKFSETYANANLREWKSTRSFFGGVVELGKLANESSKKNRFSIEFENKCDEILRIAIHYKDFNGNWKTEYWWEFDPGEKAYLNSGNIRLKTKNTFFYYYAESLDRRIKSNGNRSIEINGKNYQMKKYVDNSPVASFSLSC